MKEERDAAALATKDVEELAKIPIQQKEKSVLAMINALKEQMKQADQ